MLHARINLTQTIIHVNDATRFYRIANLVKIQQHAYNANLIII